MPPTLKTDVIISGAGPTGLALACQLVRYEVDFIIIDKAAGVTPYSKALGVHARTLEIYEQLGLAQKAVEQGTIAGKVRLLERGEVLGQVELSNIGKGLSAYPFMLVLEQSRNEQLMYDWLKEHGQDVLWQTELEGFSQDATTVTAQVKVRSAESQTIAGKYLVGCDGPHSPVRHALGLAFEGSTFERLFYVADVVIDWKFTHDALTVCLAPHGVVAFFPMPGEKRWRIVGAFPEGHEKDEHEILYEEIEAQIKKEAQLELDITRVDWFSTYKVHTRHVDKFSAGRCFVAGDAAHIHTPAGGQGMNTGIQDAYNLAWKLALVLKHSAQPQILDTYNEERLPNAKRLTATTDRMFNLAAGKDWFVGLIRTTIFPPLAKYILSIEAVRKKFFILISQIGISYRAGSLSLHEIGGNGGDDEFEVKAGDRLPYFEIDGKNIYERLHTPKFHLLMFSDGAAVGGKLKVSSDDGAGFLGGEKEANATEARYAELVDCHLIPLDPNVAGIFGTDKPFDLLLRPDNYIGFISSDMSGNSLSKYFARLFDQ
ncbi:MAG: FAD-dependent monooxygenase [Blastocatellia bacterium]|nr:FAD-dependent monooxygenase [Blastocatellia bacterium]